MTKYTYAQLEGIWIANGGSKATAPMAAAIAEAESGGESSVTSPNPDGGTNVGLWQLDTRGVGAGFNVGQLQDPSTNAQVTIKGTGNGRNWSHWQTFVDGSYKAFLSTKTSPASAGPGTGSSGGGVVQADITAYSPDTCVWTFPGISMPVIGNVGQFCIFSKSQARALVGGVLLVGGAFTLILPGLAFLVAAAGVKALGAAGPMLEKTGAAVALIPGAEPAGVAIAGAGAAGKSSAAQTQRRRRNSPAAQEERAAERQLGEPRENPGLREGRGAVRETSAETRRRQGASRSRARRAASPGPAASVSEAGF